MHGWYFVSNLKFTEKSFSADALRDTLGLKLVGPFDVLAGAHKNLKSKPNVHLHWRFFYDPPEFQTILHGSDDRQHHFGYYRYRTCLVSLID